MSRDGKRRYRFYVCMVIEKSIVRGEFTLCFNIELMPELMRNISAKCENSIDFCDSIPDIDG
jgi:hypothetical protein